MDLLNCVLRVAIVDKPDGVGLDDNAARVHAYDLHVVAPQVTFDVSTEVMLLAFVKSVQSMLFQVHFEDDCVVVLLPLRSLYCWRTQRRFESFWLPWRRSCSRPRHLGLQ
jgi:hypothetical protein